jgi:nitrile hydratase subunit beta
MNGIHDLGGMDGFASIEREENEPVFHSAWERRTFALAMSSLGSRCFNIDEFRGTVERMPPVRYLSASYYERWLYSLEALLVKKGIVTRAEIEAAMRDQTARGAGADAAGAGSSARTGPARIGERVTEKARRPRFRTGERVLAKNINPPGHTRLPRYARGKHGTVRYDWGVFVFPDSHAQGAGRKPQHCYGVEFAARELWGNDHTARDRVYLDLWEDYLEPDREGPRQIKKAPAKETVARTKPKAAAKRRTTTLARRERAR